MALTRVKAMEYVELWYFTSEGILDASKITPTTSDETIGLVKTDSGLAIQPIKASKASRNAILDGSLSWEQIMTARYNILDAASKWPEEHRISMAELCQGHSSLTPLVSCLLRRDDQVCQ